MITEPPEGIIITISAGMIKEKGYRNWLRNYLTAMNNENWVYWMRLGSKPKHDLLYVYLCIGNKIRYRSLFVATEGPKTMTFYDGKDMSEGKTIVGKAWVIMCGPVLKAPGNFPMKGFRGFRYTQKIF